jgi:hypothetical protein
MAIPDGLGQSLDVRRQWLGRSAGDNRLEAFQRHALQR